MRGFVLSVFCFLMFSGVAEAESFVSRVHKDKFVEYCTGRDKPVAFCECNMGMVNEMSEKAKETNEKIFADSKNKVDKAVSMLMKKRIVKDHDEAILICETQKKYDDKEMSEEEYAAFVSDKGERNVTMTRHQLCMRYARHKEHKVHEYLENKEYEYVNPHYIMTNNNPCKKHIR